MVTQPSTSHHLLCSGCYVLLCTLERYCIAPLDHYRQALEKVLRIQWLESTSKCWTNSTATMFHIPSPWSSLPLVKTCWWSRCAYSVTVLPAAISTAASHLINYRPISLTSIFSKLMERGVVHFSASDYGLGWIWHYTKHFSTVHYITCRIIWEPVICWISINTDS